MRFKTILKSLLFLTGVILLPAAMPSKKDTPPEMTAFIEKKWPGSKMVLISQQPDSKSRTILYKITQSIDTLGWAYTRRVYSCRNGGCDQLSLTDESSSREYFEYFAIIDNQHRITDIKVYNYAATHGEEICSKAWLKQFKGYKGAKPLRYGKDIDAISGATISGKAITEDISSSMIQLKK